MTQRGYICRAIVCVTFVRREALQLADSSSVNAVPMIPTQLRMPTLRIATTSV